jgi:hypothetical protein
METLCALFKTQYSRISTNFHSVPLREMNFLPTNNGGGASRDGERRLCAPHFLLIKLQEMSVFVGENMLCIVVDLFQ